MRPLLVADGLVRHFFKPKPHPFAKPRAVRAVDGVSLFVRPGETLGIVGESGCGKSTTGKLIVGIDQPTRGRVVFDGVDLSTCSKPELRALRRDIQMIFQNPMAALDPRLQIGKQIREPLDIHDIGTEENRIFQVLEMLDAVGLPADFTGRFPHELSGGQAQRVVIARALIVRPKLIVCDEPVSALDVSVQAQVLELLAGLQKDYGMAYLFISHDLKVVKQLCHRIAVMYLGEIVEEGDCNAVFANPQHPYTQALISAIPNPDPTDKPKRVILKGDPPSPLSPPSGCRFHTRCPQVMGICSQDVPQVSKNENGSAVACHLYSLLEVQA